MVDIVSAAKRSEMMAGIRGKNTKPEMTVRKLLHAAGFRFRLHDKQLPGKPDIVLPKWQTVIFVHGCFWHGHENCRIFRLPKSRQDFWKSKITDNTGRDKVVRRALTEAGWKIVVIWECSMKGKGRLNSADLITALTNAVRHPMLLAEIRGQDWQ